MWFRGSGRFPSQAARRARQSRHDLAAVGRESLSASAWLLANTTKLTIATGIANIYARDAQAVAAGKSTLNELSNGRFLLGLGVSHVPLVEGRHHRYGKPVETMRAYLKAMGEAAYFAAPPPERPKTVIAALGPKMLALAAELADGALPYNVTPEHTAHAQGARARQAPLRRAGGDPGKRCRQGPRAGAPVPDHLSRVAELLQQLEPAWDSPMPTGRMAARTGSSMP